MPTKHVPKIPEVAWWANHVVLSSDERITSSIRGVSLDLSLKSWYN